MRLDHLDLLRFGHFTGRHLTLPVREPDYYVIYGDNEAGKSTLLRGISSLLFGVPAKTVDVHSCKPSELRIGATISNGQRTLSFRRRKGTAGTLLSPEEGQISESFLSGFLRELDRDRFEQFFGLTHQRLRDGGDELLRGKGDIGSALFQAAGLLDLRNLLARLDSEAKELFTAKSRTKTINSALDEYKDAKAEMRRLAISAHSIKQRHAELDKARNAHERLKAESESLQQELVRLRRIATNKPDIARLQELRTALQSFDNTPTLSADARRLRDDASTALADATAQIQALTGHILNRRERIASLHVSTLLKSHAKDIEELIGGTNDYHHSVNDKPKRLSERASALERARSEWRTVWPNRPVEDAEALRAVYNKKSDVFRVITEHARLTTALVNAEEQAQGARDQQDSLQRQFDQCSDPGDPAVLIAAIEQAKALGDVDTAIARLKSDRERIAGQLSRDIKQLHGWSGTIEDLDTARIPFAATIARYVSEWDALRISIAERNAQVLNVAGAVQQKQLEVARLTNHIRGAGESTLAEARERRDSLWGLISGSLIHRTPSVDDAQDDAGGLKTLESDFTESLRRADELADTRFANAADVAVHDRLVRDVAADQSEQRRLTEELVGLRLEEGKLRARWIAEWDGLKGDVLSPAEMKEWVKSREAILARFSQHQEKQEELALMQKRSAAASDQLLLSVAQFQKPLLGSQSLSITLRVAEGLAKQIQDQRRLIVDLNRQLQMLSPEKSQAKEQECKRRLADWTSAWLSIVGEWLLPSDYTPDQMSGAIAVLEKVFEHLREADALQHRIGRISENISLFESRVGRLVNAVDPSLSSRAPDAAVTDLHARLVESGKAETERGALEQQNTRDQDGVASYTVKAQRAEGTLRDLRELGRCETMQELEAVIAASEEMSEKRAEYERIARGLIERNAAPELLQIEDEASAYELDSLRAAVFNSESRFTSIQDEAFKAGSDYGTLRQDFDRLEASDESTLQAQRAEDALGRVRPALSHYLRLRIASEILQRAIDSYREKHQGPVLSRAGELFAGLTVGEYSGLTTAFADNDKSILVATRKNKESVEIEGLSEGTRDQMYLALRLAAIEHHVQTVSPCPVILDDILINADDARATAALQILAKLAAQTQVLFFTHHRHLANLCRDAGAQVVELGGTKLAARAY